MSLRQAFRDQSVACAALGSPFMGRLMGLLASRLTRDHGPIAAKMFDWPGEVGPRGDNLPLRLAGGLHGLRLAGDAGLAAVYPPHEATDDDVWHAVSDAMIAQAATLDPWIDRPPQTNEIRRAAVLRAAGQWLTARFGLPLDLMEVGTSAGLNLNWDRFALYVGGTRHGPSDAVLDLTPDWDGPPPPAVEPRIRNRAGADIAPLHPNRDGARLMAYLWPDQPDRLDRMHRALTLPVNAIDRADAADWLAARLAPPPDAGVCRMICHTVAWQYFTPATATRATAAIEAAGARATADTPLAWLGMEADGQSPGAALTLRLWPGDLTLDAGRADFHGRWVRWQLT